MPVAVSELPEAETRAARALDLIMRVRDLNDREMAVASGLGRESVRSKRRGLTKITRADGERLAGAARVPMELLDRTEPDILRWFADEWAARDSNPEPADFTPSETFVTTCVFAWAA